MADDQVVLPMTVYSSLSSASGVRRSSGTAPALATTHQALPTIYAGKVLLPMPVLDTAPWQSSPDTYYRSFWLPIAELLHAGDVLLPLMVLGTAPQRSCLRLR